MHQGKQVEKQSRLLPLSPILDSDGMIRMKRRTVESPNLDMATKMPIILDPSHHVTKLLLQWYHEKYHHQGQETVLNEVRQKFYIISPRSAVRQAFHRCRRCQLDKPPPSLRKWGRFPRRELPDSFVHSWKSEWTILDHWK